MEVGKVRLLISATTLGLACLPLPRMQDHAGEKWIDLLGWFQGETTVNDDGWAQFSCHARSVAIWIKQNAKGRGDFSH